jgi:hypothetical protein
MVEQASFFIGAAVVDDSAHVALSCAKTSVAALAWPHSMIEEVYL